MNRAVQAGQLLAHVLASGAHGGRPVTLVGYSMGARLVFHCLLELAALRARGVVEAAALLGAPVRADRRGVWAAARAAVAGRLVNGYSSHDWARDSTLCRHPHASPSPLRSFSASPMHADQPGWWARARAPPNAASAARPRPAARVAAPCQVKL